jgi:membrane protease YdiL (CAAX protease family)
MRPYFSDAKHHYKLRNKKGHAMTSALGWIYALGMFSFTIAFFIDWIKSEKDSRKYAKYGIGAGVIVIGSYFLIIVITPSALQSTPLSAILVSEAIIFLRLAGFNELGMHYLASTGYPSFPILLRKFGVASDEKKIITDISDNNADAPAENLKEVQLTDPPASDTLEQVHIPSAIENQLPSNVLLDIKWKDYFLTILSVSAIGILYSVGLFRLTSPHMSELAQQRFGAPSTGSSGPISLQGILFILEVAIFEEIVFRLGIQSFLVKYLKLKGNGYWIAILITSALWTLGHVGVLDPEWVKLAQIFPLGLLLGWLFRKYGAESTILAHALFNIVLAFLAPYLLGR